VSSGFPAPAAQIAESVCAGHPDKVADQISDTVLDAFLAQDPGARVNCEVLVTRGTVVATGQITAAADVNIDAIIRGVLTDVGFTHPDVHGLSAETADVRILIDQQSREIADGVDRGGAGDSGIVYGYATDETPERMPLACLLAHDIARRVAVTADGEAGPLGPDGKVQVQLSGSEGVRDAIVVVSAQHQADVALDTVRAAVAKAIVEPALTERGVSVSRVIVNPAGSFVVGGPAADAGLTGRKLMVDSYGPLALHGGGCYSGKDATKVDRSGAYFARYLASNVVASGLARRCQIGLGFAIGQPEPVWFDVCDFGTSELPAQELADGLRSVVDQRVETMVEWLRGTAYRPTAAYGHFGRLDLPFPWEELALTDTLRRLA
jgi:S-adenosylmethionine synthetase